MGRSVANPSPTEKMIDSFQSYKTRVETLLDKHLGSVNAPRKLIDAMRYGVFNGGKRIRPILCYLTTEALGQTLEQADDIAAAIELIHCYSLIHDDLPAMDDDALRRGKPTLHIEYDEATAILAGDALQTLAFEIIASGNLLDAEIKLELIQLLSRRSGASGMVAGQMMDIEAENNKISKSELMEMHNRKTGDLISCSIKAGAIIGRAKPEEEEGLQAFGYALGLAFQVRDDILDETGDTHIMGKLQGSDLGKDKSTFVSIYGLDGAKEHLTQLQQKAKQALSPLGDRAQLLTDLSTFIIQRQY